MKKNDERKKKLDFILKIIVIVIIIILLIHNCVILKGGKHDGFIISIDCEKSQCNAALKSLTIDSGNLNFKSSQFTYDVTVDSNVSELTINAMPFETTTKVEIEPHDMTLKEGLNVFKVITTDKNGDVSVYTINVYKKPSESKIIENIIVNPVGINFDENIYEYTIDVDNSVIDIAIEVIPVSEFTTITYPDNLSLNVGTNKFTVNVITEDGRTVKYTINVNRAKKSVDNPILKELTVSPNGIAFNDSKYNYDIEVDAKTDNIIINALPFESSTKVIIPSDLTLKEGLNTFVVEAITKDGKSVKYTINVHKKGIDNKVIKDITIGPQDIEFQEDNYIYDIEVDELVNKITLSAIPYDEEIDVVITPSNLTLKEGLNTFKVEATNKDGITKVYTINITKKGSTKVLKDIVVGPQDIEFQEDNYEYDIEVENDVTSITLNPITYNSATNVIITPSNLSLNEGLNTFKVEATNKSGITKIYVINVTRKESPKGVIVSDKNIRWSEITSLEIFENPLFNRGKIIAPESSNTYQFEIKNSTNYKIKYQISFNETNIYNINMKYKLKKNDTYLIDHYVSASDLIASNIELDVNKKDIYYLEWKWISSNNDTEIGEIGNASYALKINVEAESIDG